MALKRILLVDDDKAINFLNRLALKKGGVDCEVFEALDGLSALEQIAANDECPDVILLDINMPIVDGFEFLKHYEIQGKCCGHSKIFMVTSSARNEDRDSALSNRFVSGYFDKPLSNTHIRHILATVNNV